MSGFIRCPSCGFAIGLYEEAYSNARLVLLEEKLFNEKKYDINKLETIPGSIPEMKDIFDSLNIENQCCRMRLFTNMKFEKILGQ
jgi:hypothetical protein